MARPSYVSEWQVEATKCAAERWSYVHIQTFKLQCCFTCLPHIVGDKYKGTILLQKTVLRLFNQSNILSWEQSIVWIQHSSLSCAMYVCTYVCFLRQAAQSLHFPERDRTARRLEKNATSLRKLQTGGGRPQDKIKLSRHTCFSHLLCILSSFDYVHTTYERLPAEHPAHVWKCTPLHFRCGDLRISLLKSPHQVYCENCSIKDAMAAESCI